MQDHLKGDERILGDSDFVQAILKSADESLQEQYRLKTKGYDYEKKKSQIYSVVDDDNAAVRLRADLRGDNISVCP